MPFVAVDDDGTVWESGKATPIGVALPPTFTDKCVMLPFTDPQLPLLEPSRIHEESMRFRDRIRQQFADSAMAMSVPSSLFGEQPIATSQTIANTTFNLDEAMAVYRDMKAKANELRAREKETLARLTVGYHGQPVEPIVSKLEKAGFKVYVNIDYDPPCSGNAIVLLASEGKLVRFHSVHWGG